MLDAYFQRINYAGPRQATVETLDVIHLAHASTIPFENLEVLMGSTPRLDLEGIVAKLIEARRGGYCFEHNTLLAAVLKQLGFKVTELGARVRLSGKLLPRTHMCLLVEVEGLSFLADAGFGAELLSPVPLRVGCETSQFGRRYRLIREAHLWVLQRLEPDPTDLYAFTLEPQHPVDFVMANHFTATHPNSIFRNVLTVQRPHPEVRYHLHNHVFHVHQDGQTEARPVRDQAEMGQLLEDFFGIRADSALLALFERFKTTSQES
ncbi:MAG: arylamine N-acetyltransferase [Candidatus Eremiobacteraeota bacterium]|nr:arylamine N-acetyltransferase [Candidatus Eremiobacteraeota bacterium]